ncbi:MAG: efflux RND transporter periplasmic adaptor subunit [Nitrospirota bacterium]
MKRKNKIAIVFIIAAIIAIAAYMFLYSEGEKGPEKVRTTGVVEGIETNISSRIAGRITFIGYREGAVVKKGQLIARIENEDLQAALKATQSALRAEELTQTSLGQVVANSADQVKVELADVANQIAQEQRAQSQLALAELNLSREKELYKKGIVAKADLDNAQTTRDSAKADVDAALASINLAKSKHAAAQAGLKKAKEDVATQRARVSQASDNVKLSEAQLSYSDIFAPSDGVVEYRSVEEGEVVSPGMSILTVVDPSTLWVRFDLEQRFVTKVRVGTKARVWLEHHPDMVFDGEVFDVGREGEFAVERDVTRGRQDIKTFRTRIKINDPKGILKPGMTVMVEIP